MYNTAKSRLLIELLKETVDGSQCMLLIAGVQRCTPSINAEVEPLGFSVEEVCMKRLSCLVFRPSHKADYRLHTAGSVANRNFWTFSPPPPHPTEFRDQSIIFRRPRGMCVKSLPAIECPKSGIYPGTLPYKLGADKPPFDDFATSQQI